MIHSVALVIADFLFSKDVITEEEKEVCAYGMELIISGIASVNSASFFATYQPKEPDVLKKKETK